MHAYVDLVDSSACTFCPRLLLLFDIVTYWSVVDSVLVLVIQGPRLASLQGHITERTCGLAWANLYRSSSGVDAATTADTQS
jgi:hypothetical protein